MIVVTGATGHIGNVLVRELLQRGETVRALVLPGEDCSLLKELALETVEGNICDLASLRNAFCGVEYIYHLAGLISIVAGQDALVNQVNVEGTRNVIIAARECGVKRLVYTSSIHAIQRVPHGVVIDETLPFDPQNPAGEYDRSKARASLVVQEAVRDGLNAVIVCPTGVIGPYDYRGSELGLLMLGWMKPGLHPLVDGNFDFVDVRDVARGMILACEKGKPGETYILSGEHVSLQRMKELVQEIVGIRTPTFTVPFNLAHFFARISPFFYRLLGKKPQFTPYSLETVTSNSVISNAKARNQLGYSARATRDTVADTVRWWQDRLRSGRPVRVVARIPGKRG